ncbi:hypothetical protein MTsDn5_26370 [Alteromonas gracilis]
MQIIYDINIIINKLPNAQHGMDVKIHEKKIKKLSKALTR